MRTKFKAFLLLRCSFERLLQTSEAFPPFDTLLPANLPPPFGDLRERRPADVGFGPFREIPDRFEYSVYLSLF